MSAPPPAVRRGLLAAAGTIAVITLLARVVGFGRWFAFSHSVGATCVGSVYQSVNAVPNVLFEIAAGGVLAAVAVPLVAGPLARGDREHADRTASALLTWALIVLVPLGVVVALAARPVATALLGTGCSGEVELGTELLVVFAAQIPLYGVGIVLGGILQSHHRFVAAALAPLLSSLVVIATYLTYRALVTDPAVAISSAPRAAVVVLGVGTTLGVAALSLPLLVPVARAGIRLRPRLTFPEGVARRARALAAAGLLAVAGQQLATLVVIRLANDRGGAGTLNVFTYAQAVVVLPYAVLAVPLATAAFPSLAGAHALEDTGERPGTDSTRDGGSAETLRRAWLASLVVSVLGAAALVAVATPVGSFFTALDAGARVEGGGATLAAMADTVTLLAASVPALAVIALLSRASYVRGTAVLAGCVVGTAWLSTTLLPLLTLDPDGAGPAATLRALAAGSSAGLLAGALLLVLLTVRTWGSRALAVPVRPVVAAVVGGGAGALTGRVASISASLRGWDSSLGGSLVVGVVVGVVSLGVMAGVALAVDPSLARRLRRTRRAVHAASDGAEVLR